MQTFLNTCLTFSAGWGSLAAPQGLPAETTRYLATNAAAVLAGPDSIG